MARPAVSFCITTDGPADRVRVLLELVRPHVDEIVLAADRDGGQETLEVCADLADRRLTFELERSPVWLAGWILHQCSGEWILRLDDDEVPSAALLEALPEIVSDRFPTVVTLDRRWLHRSADGYITSFPWSHEPQPRLVRNVPSLWRFSGNVHESGEWLGEVRMSELAIYHLVLLLRTREEREAKRDDYERRAPLQSRMRRWPTSRTSTPRGRSHPRAMAPASSSSRRGRSSRRASCVICAWR